MMGGKILQEKITGVGSVFEGAPLMQTLSSEPVVFQVVGKVEGAFTLEATYFGVSLGEFSLAPSPDKEV